MLEQLTPTQRTAVYVGVPLVAGAVIVAKLRTPAAPADPPPDGEIAGTTTMASTDAIGTGTLASWATGFTQALADISGRITTLETGQPTKLGGTTTTKPPTTPGPVPPSQRSDLGKRRTTVLNHKPPGRGFGGETPGELALRLYGSRNYSNYIRFFNNQVWPGSPDKAIHAGTTIAY